MLAVGIDDRKTNTLRKDALICVLSAETGSKAVKYLRQWKIDSLVSGWDLPDMADGQLLEKVRSAKPSVPTIAIIRAGDRSQEIAARGLGVSAVLSEDMDDSHFCETVRQLLRLESNEYIRDVHICKKFETIGSDP